MIVVIAETFTVVPFCSRDVFQGVLAQEKRMNLIADLLLVC